MDAIKQYLLGILSAALVCSVLTTISGKNKTTGSIVKMLCGLFLAVTLVSPLVKWNFQDWSVALDLWDADQAVGMGQLYSDDQMAAIIKEQAQAYILDKAGEMGADIGADVSLSEHYPYAPEQVFLSGSISPYNKQLLTKIIATDLAIPEERQIWNSNKQHQN